jgi:hypothetical protein
VTNNVPTVPDEPDLEILNVEKINISIFDKLEKNLTVKSAQNTDIYQKHFIFFGKDKYLSGIFDDLRMTYNNLYMNIHSLCAVNFSEERRYIHIYIYIYIYLFMHLYLYTYMHTYTYKYLCIYVYINT